MAGANIIKVEIVGDDKSLTKTLKHTQGDVDTTGKSTSKFAAVASAAFAGVAVGAAKLAEVSLKAAEAQESAHNKLDQALDVTRVKGGQWVSDAEKQGVRFGKSQAEIDDALAVGVRGLGSAEKARRALTVAEDVAAATGKPLADAMLLTTKVAEGQSKGLKGLGIDTSSLTSEQLKNGAGLDLLAQKYAGSASAASDTFAGKSAALHAELTNLEAEAGQKLQPVLLAVGKAALAAADFFDKHKVVAAALAVVIGTVTAALVIQKAVTTATAAASAVAKGATAAWTAAQWLWNAALDANPIGLVVLAIAGLIGAGVLLVKHWSTVRSAVGSLWDGIKSIFLGGVAGIEKVMSGVADVITWPYKQAFKFLITAWDDTVGKLAHGQSYGFDVLGKHIGITLPNLNIPVPSFHTGGIFNAQAGEGLAWLKSGEGIFTPDQMAAIGGGRSGNLIINGSTITPTLVTTMQRRYNRRNGIR
jgi:hypothetical protein